MGSVIALSTLANISDIFGKTSQKGREKYFFGSTYGDFS